MPLARGTMSAIVAPGEPEQVRLWTGSALAALLVHLAVAALLFLHLQRPPPPPTGSPVAVDVKLASLPASASSVASSPLHTPSTSRQQQVPSTRPALAGGRPLQPVAEVRPIAQQAAPAPSHTALAQVAGGASAPAGLSGLGTSNLTAQLWLSEVKARLESYKKYPGSAIAAKRQDTVMLHFSVDRAGRVTSSRIDSSHHYRSLEQEVQRMLRLAGPLPTPPLQLPVKGLVVTVPIQFHLTFRYCKGSHCRNVSAPLAKAGKGKLQVIAPPAVTLADCVAPARPGPAPAGGAATLAQMRAYRQRLKQYLAAGGNQLGCLSQVPGAIALDARKALTRRLHALVDNFNHQARLFESHAQAEALQAQRTRQRQLQARAVQAYAACRPPTGPRAPASALTADSAQSYRRELVGYQSALRRYVACLRQADLRARAPGRGLASDQRVQLDRTRAQLGNAAIQSFNRLVARFNAQVPRLRRQALAEVVVRAKAIFPNSTWSVPAPLPTDECFRITRSGQRYQAQVCTPTYVTPVSGLAQRLRTNPRASGDANVRIERQLRNIRADAIASDPRLAKALQAEAIAAKHGFPYGQCGTFFPCQAPILGIAAAPEAGVQLLPGASPHRLQTVSYSASELQIAGRRLSLTISWSFDNAEGRLERSAMHFDLMLSPDNKTLHGYCWTGQQRRACTLPRHR